MKINTVKPLNPIAKDCYDSEFRIKHSSGGLVYGLKHDTRDFIFDLISNLPESDTSSIPLQVEIWKINDRIYCYPEINSIKDHLKQMLLAYINVYKIKWVNHPCTN